MTNIETAFILTTEVVCGSFIGLFLCYIIDVVKLKYEELKYRFQGDEL